MPLPTSIRSASPRGRNEATSGAGLPERVASLETLLALGFARLDWEVIGLDRSFDAAWEDDGIRQVTAELADGVPSDLPGVDLVVHAAWTTTDAETLGVTAGGRMSP